MKIRSSSSFLTLPKHSQRKASKQCTFTFLLPPDTLTPLSHPHHELYIVLCKRQQSNSHLKCWGKLSSERPSLWQGRLFFLCNFTTTKCWAPFKDGIRGNKDGEKQKRAKMRFLSENYRNQAKIKEDWRISSSADHYAEEQEVQQKLRGKRKQIQREYGRSPMWPYYKGYTAGTIFFNSSAL